jgi:hypothetical protein
LYFGEKYENALFKDTSSLNIPNTVEPEPDRLAYRAPSAWSFSFIFPISGYVGTTIDSKSFSKSFNISRLIVFPIDKPAKLIDDKELSKFFLNCE